MTALKNRYLARKFNTNEETGALIALVAGVLMDETNKDTNETLATKVIGELQSKYRLTPIDDKQQEGTGT